MEGFITIVRTIRHFITDQIIVDALAAIVGTLELALRTSTSLGVCFRCAVPLIRSVTAVVLLIATVRHSNTLGVITGELRRAARAVLSVAFNTFVAAITAVIVVVARPIGVDAPTF